MSVTVHEPVVEGSTVECRVTASGRCRRFITGEPFRADYDVDLSGLPPALATVPVLAQVCPVAWACGEDVHVPVVDATFADALEEVGEALRGMYPEFIEGGRIRADEIVDVREARPAAEFDDEGLLFTGGVDSVASYVRHREADPALISVQGWVVDVDDDDRWAGARDHIDAFADDRGLDVQTIESNMLDVLDMPMLQAHFKRYVDGAWYSSVGHGLGLLGLTAPLADALGLETIHIAASHTAAFDEPWGSHPDIDDRVRWGHTRGNHDGYDLTRQEKIDLIADYARGDDRALPLRTCITDAAGGNCNDCEKCYRTMVGLVLAGLDPDEYGYHMTPRTFDEIRTGFENGEFVLDEHTVFHWEDIQAHVTGDEEYPVDGAAAFFEWLSTADIDALAASANPPVTDVALRAIARNVPYPAYTALYSVYDAMFNEKR